jgi:hypothetical protein
MAVLQTEDREQTLVNKLLRDHRLYCRSCLKIRTKMGALVPLNLNRVQGIIHAAASKQRADIGRVRIIGLKARQEGFSTYVASRNYRGAHLRPNRRASIIAHEKDAAGDLFSMYERFDQHMPPELKPIKRASSLKKHLIYDSKDSTHGLASEIMVETAGDTEAGRSQTIQYLHASEVAFWPEAKDTWVSIAQAVPDSDSEIWVESTANGMGNFFHGMWEDAVNGASEFVPIFLPWHIHEEYTQSVTDEERYEIEFSDDPYEHQAQEDGFEFMGDRVRLTPEQLAWRRSTIANKLHGDARLFKQEYPTTAEEAFLVSGAPFFDEQKLDKYRRSAIPPLIRGNIETKGGGVLLRPVTRGGLRVWKYPRKDGRYVIAADTAEGKKVAARRATFEDPEGERSGRDFSSAHVYDIDAKAMVASLHGRMAAEVFAKALWNLGWFYTSAGRPDQGVLRQPAFLAVERIGSGHTVLHILKNEYRYPNLFYHRQVNRRTNRVTTSLGWVTNVETRMPMLDDFAAAIRNESVALYDADTIREMMSFVYNDEGKPEAQQGAHDDRVMSAAMAHRIAQYAPSPASALPAGPSVAATATGWDDYGYAGEREIAPSWGMGVDEEDPFWVKTEWGGA